MYTNIPSSNGVDTVRALEWANSGLQVLDQRRLPDEVVYETFDSVVGVAEAIRSMRVRGAPAIGIAAAYGVVLAVRQRYAQAGLQWREAIPGDLDILAASRPTAVNLFWALDKMQEGLRDVPRDPEPDALQLAKTIHQDDIDANRYMGELGAEILTGCEGVLTHCNTGSLATGGYGTALGVIRSAVRQGLKRIFATETRPWLQGARLTVWELQQDRIAATLLADSAAASLMRSGAIQWVIVGADRITANGDVANKIGTYSLAVLARNHGVKFMVVAPTSTIDWRINNGEDIEIEQRAAEELLPAYYMDEESCIGAWNPVFDITPAELIDTIVTEKGVVQKPGEGGLESIR